MNSPIYPTSTDCEDAFYRAFEKADLAAMMAVWAEDDEVACIHPGGPRLRGLESVRESWRGILAGGPGLRVDISHRVVTTTLQTAIHTLHENLAIPGEPRTRGPIIATNVYLRTERGWRMVLHHASPAPAERAPTTPARGAGPAPLLH
ncbi:MAG: YybH family protein [Pseudomonadota bacterium]|jgi:ketosteroid isomerase-like protein